MYPRPNIKFEDILQPEANVRWFIRTKETPLVGQISWHGYRDQDFYGGHPGTWCFYLIVPQQMFLHRWLDFAPTLNQYGYWKETSAFEDEWFHGGITYVNLKREWNRKEETFRESIMVGCDYNHIWDEEVGYSYSLEGVKQDCTQAMEAFLKKHPDHYVCSGWSGRYGPKDTMILCKNGAYRHPGDTGWEEYAHWAKAEA